MKAAPILSRTAGFTLLEVLLVILMMGVLAVAGYQPYVASQQNRRLADGAEQFARDLQGQHFAAKRFNASRTATVTASATSYQLGTTTVRLPDGVKFSSTSSGTVTFYPPYGTTIQSNGTVPASNLQTFTLQLQNTTKTKTVTVIGLSGKVIVK